MAHVATRSRDTHVLQLAIVSRTSVAGAFLLSLLQGLLDWPGLRVGAANLAFRSDQAVTIALPGVVATELGIGVLLLLPWRRSAEIGSIAAIVLLVVFTSLMVRAVAKRSAVQCHCFGRSEETVSSITVVRNFLLLGFAAITLSATFMGVGPTAGFDMALGWTGPALALLLVLVNAETVVRVMQRPIDR